MGAVEDLGIGSTPKLPQQKDIYFQDTKVETAIRLKEDSLIQTPMLSADSPKDLSR